MSAPQESQKESLKLRAWEGEQQGAQNLIEEGLIDRREIFGAGSTPTYYTVSNFNSLGISRTLAGC